MRKHIVLATLIGFCALSVTACQRGDNKPATPAGGTTAEQTTPGYPGSESLTTAAGGTQTEQPANNGTPELAASSANAPTGQDMMQNQSADSAPPAANGTMPPASPGGDAGANTPAAPTDQNGTAMPGTPPSAPGDQNPGMGNGTNPPAGTGTPPAAGDNTGNKPDSNTDSGSSMSPDQK